MTSFATYFVHDCCYANAFDDKQFSSNAGDAMRRRGETKYVYGKNKSERNLC